MKRISTSRLYAAIIQQLMRLAPSDQKEPMRRARWASKMRSRVSAKISRKEVENLPSANR
ncbi:hypothetical protein [Paludisphaera borealis]|uniref:hypothetical protein n=1 Tax=Paludisphaera borealis TaxID=1387353 RepID=UPI0011AB8A88|nr:hypothetical protein [Paludisphaera borealis]